MDQPERNGYEFDVFLSYKRDEDRLILPWVTEVVRLLRFWLTNELGGRKARIFFDEQSIEAGENWPRVIRDALRSSCCLVAVWTPSYFRSHWCVSEWKSFLEREKLTGRDLVAPMRFHDGEHFDPEAKDVQMFDVRRFANTAPVFWMTEAAKEFEDRLKKYVKEVANLINAAPPFQPDWPVGPHPPMDEKLIDRIYPGGSS